MVQRADGLEFEKEEFLIYKSTRHNSVCLQCCILAMETIKHAHLCRWVFVPAAKPHDKASLGLRIENQTNYVARSVVKARFLSKEDIGAYMWEGWDMP